MEQHNQDYINRLLSAWEETYKKGQMSFWILLSIKEKARYPDEIAAFIMEYSGSILSFDEQSIYRALRKFYELELVTYVMRDGNKGPKRKYYQLTLIGKVLLSRFIERNISVYQHPELIQLINSNDESTYS